MREVIHLYRKLWDKLPETIRFLDEKPAIFSDNFEQMKQVFFLSEQYKAVQKFIYILEQNTYFIDEPSLKYQSASNFWHIDAVFITQEILLFTKSRNLQFSIKQANSKLIQLIHYILKRIDIRTVSQSTIVQDLRRFKSEKKYIKLIKYAPD